MRNIKIEPPVGSYYSTISSQISNGTTTKLEGSEIEWQTSDKIQIPTQIKEGYLKQEWKTHWNFRELGFGEIPSLKSKLSSNM